MKLTQTITLAATAVLLSACGGGGESDFERVVPAVAGNEVPASATASASAYARFAASLTNSETKEALDVQNVSPPTSETDEPIAI